MGRISATEICDLAAKQLGYAPATGLIKPSVWDGREIANLRHIHAPGEVPTVYFGAAEDDGQEAQLRRAVYSQSQARLLVVARPDIVRVYNAVESPYDSPGHFRAALAELVAAELTARGGPPRALQPYARRAVDAGRLWEQADYRADNRATSTLLRAVRSCRDALLGHGLTLALAFRLLSRALFIRYLSDRGSLAPRFVAALSGGRFERFEEAIEQVEAGRLTVSQVYTFFDALAERFNGSMFPVEDDEAAAVAPLHLAALRQLVDRDYEQYLLWPLDFSYLPIGFMSGLYDTFLDKKAKKDSGSYYTTLPLVDFVLRETMPRGECRSDWRVLDPACGSGAFVVRALGRLLAAWCDEHQRQPTDEAMRSILYGSLRGVDKDRSALHITAFSVYVTMLEYLDDEVLADPRFRFPSLLGEGPDPTVLYEGRFESEEVARLLNGQVFDRVIGNPPWGESTASKEMTRWATSRGWDLPQKQAAPFFMARALELCQPADGEVAMLQPAEPCLLAHDSEFREQLLDRHRLRAVANLTSLRRTLNPGVASPIAAFFVRPGQPDGRTPVLHAAPKVDLEFRHQAVPVISPSDVCWIQPKRYAEDPGIWSMARWGTGADMQLMRRILRRPDLRSLKQVAERRRGEVLQDGTQCARHPQAWDVGEGAKTSQRQDAPDARKVPPPSPCGMRSTDFRAWHTECVDGERLEPSTWNERSNKRVSHGGPVVLLSHSPRPIAYLPGSPWRHRAALFGRGLVYRDSFTGIPGVEIDVELMRWIAAIYSSPVAAYWLFHRCPRSTSFAALKSRDLLAMPIAPFDANSADHRAVVGWVQELELLAAREQAVAAGNADLTSLHGQMSSRHEQIDAMVMQAYKLTEREQALVRETEEYVIPLFHWGDSERRSRWRTPAIEPPSRELMERYAKQFVAATQPLLKHAGMALDATVHLSGSAALSVVAFHRVRSTEGRIRVSEHDAETAQLLNQLDDLVVARSDPSVYYRRHVDLYAGEVLYVIRPSRSRYWTVGSAISDATEAMASWVSQG
ncbi:MAG: N-6 DNA methylase [Armatimonadetes bacterium]|nr:N-6 DNA methylase [Armatimonadota bacterium]